MIAARNEADCIRSTIENKLNLNYPAEQLEILVASDESTDGTDEIVKTFEAKGVRLIRQVPRQGKPMALNRMVAEAKGEIVVFSDANSIYQEDAVLKIVRNFSDPAVGYVTGRMVYTDEAESIVGAGCTAYMRYENVLSVSSRSLARSSAWTAVSTRSVSPSMNPCLRRRYQISSCHFGSFNGGTEWSTKKRPCSTKRH